MSIYKVCSLFYAELRSKKVWKRLRHADQTLSAGVKIILNDITDPGISKSRNHAQNDRNVAL